MFTRGNQYTKEDLYTILKVPKARQKGNWHTGYPEYDGNIYIFANVGIPGRTGHQHNNFWDGDFFHWAGKPNAHIGQDSIKKLLHPAPGQNIHLFTRKQNRSPFTYNGIVTAKSFQDTTPVKIVWSLLNKEYPLADQQTQPINDPPVHFEGSWKRVYSNRYERDKAAREKCIEHYGAKCEACMFDFEKVYGQHGEGFIHVHHILPLSKIRKNYQVNPIKDLIPLCPNCHTMIHRGPTPMTIEELKALIKSQS